MFYLNHYYSGAVFFGGSLEIATGAIIPGWLHLVALAVILFRSLDVKKSNQGTAATGTAATDTGKRLPAIAVFFLVLSAIYLTAIGGFEILSRLGMIKY